MPNQKLDLATGYTNFIQIGAKVDTKTPLAMVHYQTEEQYVKAAQALQKAIAIGNEKSPAPAPILLKI